MKTPLPLILFLMLSVLSNAQITTPVVKANFGVDADLRANYYNSFISLNGDDWFKNTAGGGEAIIDTTGAAAILSRYSTDHSFRNQPIVRRMSFPQYSVVNNRLLLDAIFVREYHGNDSTVFASGSNKNAMSPANWSCPVSQQIPDKNDILDVFMHLRRAGATKSDSLWMFGGISIENTTGNRYFDFEMFQTDLTYDRATQKFYNYGPQDGHTAWQFDAAGNVIKAGDIIFTAEYGSSSLSFIEARIWVDRASLSMTPASFNWGESFDGATSSSRYGYASIQPKTAGHFYSGLQSADNVWAGPFALVRENNTVVSNYIARQFMEFSVNLSKLGIDPVMFLGGSMCNSPFSRVLVKTRASTSFTAELKDFVAPFSVFDIPAVDALSDVPMICGEFGISNLTVQNPTASSTYTWTTYDGRIVGTSVGTSIYVDKPGMYIVTQQLSTSCTSYASDTLYVLGESTCGVLENNVVDFKGKVVNGTIAKLSWKIAANNQTEYVELERSVDGKVFHQLTTMNRLTTSDKYSYDDDLSNFDPSTIYYRLKTVRTNQAVEYSKIIQLNTTSTKTVDVKVYPNPATNYLSISILAQNAKKAKIIVVDMLGTPVYQSQIALEKGSNKFNIENITNWKSGNYIVNIISESDVKRQKIVINRSATHVADFR